MNVITKAGSSAQVSAGVAPICVFPPSFAQQRLWFLEQLQPGGTSYLIPWVLRATGKLNVDALAHSLNAVVARHEILRTTFSWRDGMPVQVVHGSLTLALPVRDLTGCANPLSEAERLAREEAHTPLDLERGPLVRAQLLRLAPEDHILLLTVHHIIFDGWSRKILVRDLAACYEAYSSARIPALPPPKLQYADFAVWQRKLFQGPNLEKHLSYWRQQLDGIPASVELPTDRPRPALQTFKGARVSIVMERELSEKVKAIGRQEGSTVFMTLLAAFQILLARYSNQNDVVVGTPIANRNRAEIEDLIGFFANTLVLRTKLAEQDTFRSIVAQVKETTLCAYDHQDLPFEKLVEELHPQRNLGQNPLFQVMFSLQNLARPGFEFAGLDLRFMDAGDFVTKFDLSVFLSETAYGISGRIDYNTDLFDRATIDRLREHYLALLEAAVRNPDACIWDLPLLSAPERQRVLVDWNDTAVEYDGTRCLHQHIEDQVARTPNAPALVFEGRRLTYRELNARANQLARYLRRLGVGPNVLVGICAERSVELVLGLLATMKAGGAYVPLDPDYPRERLASVIEDAAPPVLLTLERLKHVLPTEGVPIVCLDSDWQVIAKESDANLESITSRHDDAYAIFTSGSTGKPKGVPNVHQGIVNRLLWMQHAYRLDSSDRVLQKTPYSFDVSVWEFFWPLMTGACLVVAHPNGHKDPSYLVDLIQRERITTMHFVPSMLSIFLEADGVERCKSLRRVIASGEALPKDTEQRFFERLRAELHNLYGPTEASVDVTYWQCRPGSSRATVPIGKPIWNTQIYILDSRLNPVPIGVSGELHIGGVGLARGYLKRPELTAEKFIPDPFSKLPGARLYKTGDLARFLPDGNIEYMGRLDHQVKIRGFRIELGEIESALNGHPAVQQAVVLAREDSPGDKRLVGYVVCKSGQHLSTSDARAILKQTLPEYMLPSAVVELEALPLSANGKIDRKALPRPDYQGLAQGGRAVPGDPVEQTIFSVWQRVLNIPAIGMTDNFFDLGGHSLLAVQLVNEVKKQTGVEIPLTSLFQGATIEHMANIVRGTTTVTLTMAHQIQAGDGRPPFFAAVLAGINALGYVPLAKHLGPQQPFYTLQAPGPGPRVHRRPYSQKEYEQVAGEYVQAMRSIQPQGPYYIGGTCEGARIAFEMARVLEAQGQRAALLAIVDTWVLENTQNKRLWKLYYYGVRLRQVWQQSWRDQVSWAQKAFTNQLRRWLRPKSAPPKSAWIEVYWPSQDFVPSQIHSPITIYKIPRQPFYYHPDPLLGWENRTTSTVETRVIPHGRHRLLLREPYVRELAAALSRTLAPLHQGGVSPETIKPDRPEMVGAS